MNSTQEACAGMHVKGGLLRARFLFVLLNYGPEVWERVIATLPSEDHEALAEIVIDNWYPLRALDLIDRAIAGELGGDEQEIFRTLGEFSATSSLSGPYSSLLNPDIHSFLAQSALIHRSYQDFGAASYERLSETSGLLKIAYDPAPPVSFCVSGAAYFRRAIELCGARGARVAHIRCCGGGDPVCEFYATWQT
ncbi:MAG TPA: hypothetical protein VNO70_00755 [Blastocatellia bacterium]|nr:hypothetical protein [Blastocatellia bacterium]